MSRVVCKEVSGIRENVYQQQNGKSGQQNIMQFLQRRLISVFTLKDVHDILLKLKEVAEQYV